MHVYCKFLLLASKEKLFGPPTSFGLATPQWCMTDRYVSHRGLYKYNLNTYTIAGTSVSNLARLQLVQNTLARVVTEKSGFCHITPVLSELHWLPVRHRINFKIATITFKVLQFQQPSYLAANYSTVCANTITAIFFFIVTMCSYSKNRNGQV